MEILLLSLVVFVIAVAASARRRVNPRQQLLFTVIAIVVVGVLFLREGFPPSMWIPVGVVLLIVFAIRLRAYLASGA